MILNFQSDIFINQACNICNSELSIVFKIDHKIYSFFINQASYNMSSSENMIQEFLVKIGFEDARSQDYFIAALISRGVFADTPVSTNPRFTSFHAGKIDKVREIFSSNILGVREVDSLSLEELLDRSKLFISNPRIISILNNKLETAQFFLGIMQDFTLHGNGVEQTIVSNFSDREFGDLAAPFTSHQQGIFDFFTRDMKTPEEFEVSPGISDIAILGTAGENLKQRLTGLTVLLGKFGRDKLPAVYYTSNARYFLSCENDLCAYVISEWFLKECGNSVCQTTREEINVAILEVLGKEKDFTLNNNFDEIPGKILAAVNVILSEKNVDSMSEWPGNKYSLLSQDEKMFSRYQECEFLQNKIRGLRENFKGVPSVTKRSTVAMPPPFDYIDMYLKSSFPEINFCPHQEIFKEINKRIGEIEVPDILLCNTFDEISSYKGRSIKLDAVITDSDGFLHQRSTVRKFENCVERIVYAQMPKHNFSNFVVTLSKSLYGPCMKYIDSF